MNPLLAFTFGFALGQLILEALTFTPIIKNTDVWTHTLIPGRFAVAVLFLLVIANV